MRYQFTLGAARRRHTQGFSLQLVNLKKASAKVGLTGGMDEAHETRLRGGIGRWYYGTLYYRQRTRASRDHQDRHVRAGNRSRGRARALGAERCEAGARRARSLGMLTRHAGR